MPVVSLYDIKVDSPHRIGNVHYRQRIPNWVQFVIQQG